MVTPQGRQGADREELCQITKSNSNDVFNKVRTGTLPPFEGHAQQADQQMARSTDVFLHQDSNAVKTVEQKVRM